MKTFSAAAQAAIEDGSATVGGAAEILCSTPARAWSGEGTIQIGGNDFLGVGNHAIAQDSAGAVGSAAQGIQLVLSGIEPGAIDLLDAADLQFAPSTLWRLIFNGAGTQLLDAQVFTRGRVDRASSQETVGGQAALVVEIEGSARGLGRKGGRLRSDADQRLIDSSDSGLSRVSYAGQKTLYWGGKKPAVASTVVNGGQIDPYGGGNGNGAYQQYQKD